VARRAEGAESGGAAKMGVIIGKNGDDLGA